MFDIKSPKNMFYEKSPKTYASRKIPQKHMFDKKIHPKNTCMLGKKIPENMFYKKSPKNMFDKLNQ
jgi:hypothetical protein